MVLASSATSIVLWLAVISIPVGGYLADKTGKKDLIIIFSLISFSALLFLSAHIEHIVLIYILIGLLAGLAAGPILGLPSEVLKPENRGIGIGLFLSLFYASTVFAPALAGALLEVTNIPGVAFYLGSLMLIVAVFAQLGFRFFASSVSVKGKVVN